MKATEVVDAMKLEHQVDHKIRIRHPRTFEITAANRVKWFDHIAKVDKHFNIISMALPSNPIAAPLTANNPAALIGHILAITPSLQLVFLVRKIQSVSSDPSMIKNCRIYTHTHKCHTGRYD